MVPSNKNLTVPCLAVATPLINSSGEKEESSFFSTEASFLRIRPLSNNDRLGLVEWDRKNQD